MASPKGFKLRVPALIKDYGLSITLAVVLALLIRSSLVMAYLVPTGSMETTMEIGDRFIANKAAYDLRIPFTMTSLMRTGKVERGDVVVFQPPFESENDYVKRVIGLPGDVIEIRDKVVYVNGKRREEPYARHVDPAVQPGPGSPRDNFGPITVPAERLFVMGDNRDESYDSRFWGFLPRELVKGQAKLIYWSFDSDRFRIRWDHLGRYFD